MMRYSYIWILDVWWGYYSENTDGEESFGMNLELKDSR